MAARSILIVLTVLLARTAMAATTVDPAAAEFFEKKVRPVLADNCFRCHSNTATKLRGDLYLDSRSGILKGGSDGPAIVPGDPDQSLLVKAIRRVDPDTAMPPKTKLPDAAVADLAQWVKMGAPWPGQMDAAPNTPVVASTAPTKDPTAEYARLRRELWSWQPIKDAAAPSSPRQAWAKNDIDRFVLAKLDEKHLTPAAQADKVTLIRRASFDLIGLPPTPQEIDAFLKDSSPDAFEKVIDRLLASPHFGERWGRHWLDVARYGESTGMTRNLPYYYAWRYRDYVVSALNQDKPYNRFLTEQIAGDLLPSSSPAEHDQLLTATGFLAIGPKDMNEKNPRQFVMNNVDEQIDVTGRAILATTIACARCHDHKFDPIPTKDYYSLAGIFRSTEIHTGLARVRTKPPQYFDENTLLKLTGYVPHPAAPEPVADNTPAGKKKYRLGLLKPLEIEPLAMGVSDVPGPSDTAQLLHGDLDTPGAVVPRGFLTIPSMQEAPKIDPHHSGRLELAQWITRDDNPLTSRVIANRIWRHLFGQGIVRTVDNFGASGESPADPALLDHLAARFMADGWSIKKSIRQIMLSATYQQSSAFDHENYAIDPDNRLVWRQNQRRLEGESIRDAILSASGDLNVAPFTGSEVMRMPPAELRKALKRGPDFGMTETSRSIYLPMYRSALPEALEAFDAADPDFVTGDRDVTTVAPQALFMMNSPFVITQAGKMANRLQQQTHNVNGQIELAYRLTLGRSPGTAEKAKAAGFIAGFAREDSAASSAQFDALAAFCQVLFGSAEFRYLN